MNSVKKAKLKKFVQDEVMVEAVYEVLQSSFLKVRPHEDVYILAASRLAVDYLTQAMKEMEKYKDEEVREDKVLNQIGL